MNCCVSPLGTLGLAGVTAIDESVAEVVVRLVLDETPPRLALMMTALLPAVAVAVARPWLPLVLLIVATAASAEAQVTLAVISLVVLSL